jgi:hypothetical protein
MNIVEAISDVNLLGASIKDHVSFAPWEALLAAAFGLPLSERTSWRFTGRARGGVCRLVSLLRICGL